MIRIGLTTWSDHQVIGNKDKLSLLEYASHFPLVEVDTTFYGIPKIRTIEQWENDTPASFQFILKAHQSLTLHKKWQDFFVSEQECVDQFTCILRPLQEKKKLAAILFQFPPYFSCTKESIAYLKKIKQYFSEFPLAIELRNSSWYEPKILPSMLNFMQQNQLSLVTVDEPQVLVNSVPFVSAITTSKAAFVRLHGRNQQGWMNREEDWRKKRTLYKYCTKELNELADEIKDLKKQAEQVYVIFNNNSGGDAAPNALELQRILQLSYENLNPQQLDLF